MYLPIFLNGFWPFPASLSHIWGWKSWSWRKCEVFRKCAVSSVLVGQCTNSKQCCNGGKHMGQIAQMWTSKKKEQRIVSRLMTPRWGKSMENLQPVDQIGNFHLQKIYQSAFAESLVEGGPNQGGGKILMGVRGDPPFLYHGALVHPWGTTGNTVEESPCSKTPGIRSAPRGRCWAEPTHSALIDSRRSVGGRICRIYIVV